MNKDQETLDKIAARVIGSRKIDFGTYHYFVWPYKGIAPMEYQEIDLMVKLLNERLPTESDLLFTFQTDGEILAIPLALLARKRLVICRDIPYEMPEPLIITQHTRYWTRNLYCEKIEPNTRVVLVEALISTGSTVIEAVQRIRSCGAEVVGVVAVVSKVDYGGEARIQQQTGIVSSVLLRVGELPNSRSLRTEWNI